MADTPKKKRPAPKPRPNSVTSGDLGKALGKVPGAAAHSVTWFDHTMGSIFSGVGNFITGNNSAERGLAQYLELAPQPNAPYKPPVHTGTGWMERADGEWVKVPAPQGSAAGSARTEGTATPTPTPTSAPTTPPAPQPPGSEQAAATAWQQAYTQQLNALGGSSGPNGQANISAAAQYADNVYNQTVQQQTNGTQAQQTAQAYFNQQLAQVFDFSPAEAAALGTEAQGWITGQKMPNGLPATDDEITALIYQSPQFNQRYPGIQQMVKAGLTPLSVQQYQAYEQGIQNALASVGMPASTAGPDEVAALMAHGVSASEAADRIGTAMAEVTQNVDPQTLQYFEKTYGVTAGHLAAYFLDPNNNFNLLQRQSGAAAVGGAGLAAGFGSLSRQVTELASGEGSQSGGQAQKALSGAAPLLALTRGYGVLGGGVGSVTTGALAETALGVGGEAPQEQVLQAQQKRASSVSGGGGFGTTARGTGVGYARQTGAGGEGA